MNEKPRDGGRAWKIGLSLMVGLFLVAMATSLMLASRRVSRVVDPDYYRNGLHYGEKPSAAVRR